MQNSKQKVNEKTRRPQLKIDKKVDQFNQVRVTLTIGYLGAIRQSWIGCEVCINQSFQSVGVWVYVTL